jgi:hypothetical protein
LNRILVETVRVTLTFFGVYFEPHIFRVYYFSSKQEACQKVLCEQEVNEIMHGFSSQSLKNSFLTSVLSGFQTHSLRFLTPNQIAKKL